MRFGRRKEIFGIQQQPLALRSTSSGSNFQGSGYGSEGALGSGANGGSVFSLKKLLIVGAILSMLVVLTALGFAIRTPLAVQSRDSQASTSSSTASSGILQSESEPSSPSPSPSSSSSPEQSAKASETRVDSKPASSLSNFDSSLAMKKGSMADAIKTLKIPEGWTPTMSVDEALEIMMKNKTEDSNFYSLENIFHVRDENPMVVDIDDIAKKTLFANPNKANAKMPPIEEFTVSKQMAWDAGAKCSGGAGDPLVLVSFANFNHLDFVLNWVYHLRKVQVECYLIGAMDIELLKELWLRDIPTFYMDSGLSTKDFGWGTKTFHKMGRAKIRLIKTFLEFEIDLFLTDVDTVFLRDPIEYLRNFPDIGILTSSDFVARDAQNPYNETELQKNAHGAMNIGVMFFRHQPAVVELVDEWVTTLENDDSKWDQNVFNHLARSGILPQEGMSSRAFSVYNGKTTLGVLPVSLFMSGHTFFSQKLHRQYHRQKGPIVVHAIFQFSGNQGKRHRMREAGIWLDGPSYYEPSNNLLTYVPRIVDIREVDVSGLPRDSPLEWRLNHLKDGHFKLVMPQLKQIRKALQLAKSLDRTLIIPKTLSGYDRYWAVHFGNIPGSNMHRPYLCPLDHIFDVSVTPALDGKVIGFREQSFMLKEPAKRFVGSSILKVKASDPAENPSAISESSETLKQIKQGKVIVDNQKLTLPPNLSESEIQSYLKGLNNVKLIEIDNIDQLFFGFQDPIKVDQFMAEYKQANPIWCCTEPEPKKAGHIWYDMFYDIVPRRDRHNRLWEDEWQPTCGP